MDVRILPDHRDGELSGNLLSLTGAQASVWFHQQLDPGSVEYNVGQYIEIDGVIAPERMARALPRVVDGPEACWVLFVVRDGLPTNASPPFMFLVGAFMGAIGVGRGSKGPQLCGMQPGPA